MCLVITNPMSIGIKSFCQAQRTGRFHLGQIRPANSAEGNTIGKKHENPRPEPSVSIFVTLPLDGHQKVNHLKEHQYGCFS
jgi:hypothetical protein